MHVREDAILIDLGGDHRMRRKRELAAGKAPYVKIVHFLGAVHREQVASELVEIDRRRDRLHQDVHALADQAP